MLAHLYWKTKMKLYEVKGTGKLQGMTVMSLDAFVKGVKPEKEMDESDISGLIHAAKNYNKSFLITADCDDGKRRTYRVRAQSERVAREKFTVHHAMAKIVSVKEEGVAEGVDDEAELERLKLRQNAEHGRAPLKRQAETQARIRELEKQIKDKQGVAEGKARLPQPEDFDSDWDYQEALDAYERSQSGNDDYDYENMIDEADSENPDRITVASQGKGYIVYHSFNRDAYTARGVGEWKGQIQPEWFYSLADAEDHAEMEIAGHDEHYGKIDELTFKGSTCTKDCSGHEAGYNWYQRKGRVPNSHSKSFNKGADIAANESVNEAPGDFGLGANYRDIPDDEMQAFLDRTKNKEKTKRDKYDYPYVHASSIQIKNEEGREYDLDSLRKEIMTRPASILGQNAKMQHSETGTEAIFDIGLPALKGLAVNEKTGQFVVVDTCPGAGACKTYCYAMKGSYVMFKAVSMGLARMLNFLLNDPEGFKNKLNAEIAAARSKMAKKGARVVVRWHDAGDFFSPEYLDMAYGVARDNPDVGFYAYTKIADVATGDRAKNFNMNFSQGALSGQEKKVDFKRVKHSKVVPKDMFFDLVARKGLNLIKDAKGRMQFASPENLEDFKTRMAKHYAIDKDSILTYDQMMDTPVGDAPKWNVIVMPGDGDNSANRNDVIGSYLLFH
jgi:hypothetical protein